MKKILLPILLQLVILSASNAYSTGSIFESNGIYYEINSSDTSNTVAVTDNPERYALYEGDIEIPATVTNEGIIYDVTSIGYHAFANCNNLNSIIIPESVTIIGTESFKHCTNLSSFKIPNTVKSIGYRAFNGCTGLMSINIPNSVLSIGESAFSGCSNLTSLTIPNSITSIESYTFWGCTGLTSIHFPNSNLTIVDNAFANCTGLTSIFIANNISSIDEDAFSGCSSLATINYNAINFKQHYDSGESPFYNLRYIDTIRIQQNVNSLPGYLFENCKRARAIICESTTPPSIDATTFRNTSKNIPLYVPIDAIEDYEFDPYWGEFTRIFGADFDNNIVYKSKIKASAMTVGSGYILNQLISPGESITYNVNSSESKVKSITVNGIEMIDSIDAEGNLKLKSIVEDKLIVITPYSTDVQDVLSNSNDNNLKMWSYDNQIYIESKTEMSNIELFDLSGRLIKKIKENTFAYTFDKSVTNRSIGIIRISYYNGSSDIVKYRK